MRSARTGFTLIELLLVIGIIAVLASIVILAVNPTRQLAQARNTQRQSSVAQIINAVYQYAIDNSSLPTAITTTSTEICNNGYNTTVNLCSINTLVNLSVLMPDYLVKIPKDPQRMDTDAGTNFFINRDIYGRIVVSGIGENGATISITR